MLKLLLHRNEFLFVCLSLGTVQDKSAIMKNNNTSHFLRHLTSARPWDVENVLQNTNIKQELGGDAITVSLETVKIINGLPEKY